MRTINREYLVLIVVVMLYLVSLAFFPEQGRDSLDVAGDYLKEMAAIIPPVFILMGLFEVWVPKEFVEKHMGKDAGIKGLFLSFIFGTLPAGPVYVAFPVAATLYNKGARVRNIVIFLGVWAAAKLPQIIVEIQFLGIEFALTRLVLTIAAMIILGTIIEVVMNKLDIHISSSTNSEDKLSSNYEEKN